MRNKLGHARSARAEMSMQLQATAEELVMMRTELDAAGLACKTDVVRSTLKLLSWCHTLPVPVPVTVPSLEASGSHALAELVNVIMNEKTGGVQDRWG